MQMKNIYVQFKHSNSEAPYYMQVENESGNLRGRIIIVEEVQDPNNVNGMFSLLHEHISYPTYATTCTKLTCILLKTLCM